MIISINDVKLATYLKFHGFQFIDKKRKLHHNSTFYIVQYNFEIGDANIEDIKTEFINNPTISRCLSDYDALRKLESN